MACIEIDAVGNKHVYGANGNLIYLKRATDEYEEWYEYDTNGKLSHIVGSDGYEAWFKYNANGEEIHWWDSTGFECRYEYASNGNIIHWWNSEGNEAWFGPDGNRITKEEFEKLKLYSKYD